jgi:hypothetical protein
MSQKEVMDLENENVGEIDDSRAERPPAGNYSAKVKEIADDDKHPGGKVFRFGITLGPWKGCSITEWLTATHQGKTPESQRRIKQRRILFAKRLGLLDSTASGQCVEIDWDAAIGLDVVIKAKEEEQDGKPRTRLEWDGLYRAIDPRAAEVLGEKAPQPLADESSVPPPRFVPRPAPVDYGSL